jgi:hypothetical protein
MVQIYVVYKKNDICVSNFCYIGKEKKKYQKKKQVYYCPQIST